jgi:AcrR family transcriptional regulator
MPKVVDREAYRAVLLERCFRLFARHGYAAVTMRELAGAAKVSTGTLYHYFASKEELFAQLLRGFLANDLGEAVSRVTTSGSRPERLETLARLLSTRERRFQEMLLLTLEHQRVSTTRSARRQVALAAEALRTALREALLLSEDEATAVLRQVLGTLVHRLLDPAAAQARLPAAAVA